MRLDYTVEPTEILTVTTPLGTQHAIPIWRPIGERSKPVMVEELPKAAVVPRKGLRALMVEYIEANDPDSHGMTCWQIADALGENRQTVGRYLQDNKNTFWRSSRKVTASYQVNNGENRLLRLPVWHLRKEAE